MDFILQWIDVVWLLVAGFITRRNHRALSIGFVAACMTMLRLQVELMNVIGYPNGILNILSSDLFYRGVAVYSCFYAGFFLMAHYSREARKAIFMAASISVFFIAMFISSIFMLL